MEQQFGHDVASFELAPDIEKKFVEEDVRRLPARKVIALIWQLISQDGKPIRVHSYKKP